MQPQFFEVQYNDKTVKIEVISMPGERIFRAHFSDQAPLILNRAKKFDSTYFWTSIPQGKQKLAEEIGALIEQHIKSQQ